jgi:hypothetical protein
MINASRQPHFDCFNCYRATLAPSVGDCCRLLASKHHHPRSSAVSDGAFKHARANAIHIPTKIR